MIQGQSKKTLGMAITSLVLGCFGIIPIIGILPSIAALILGIVAVVKINQNKETLKGTGLATSGIVLGAIGIFILPIVGILAAIAIPNFLRAKASAYDSMALSNVKTISVALEVYEVENGVYPSSESELTSGGYLAQSFDGAVVGGHSYSVELNPDYYAIRAQPQDCYTTGTKIFFLESGQELVADNCSPGSD